MKSKFSIGADPEVFAEDGMGCLRSVIGKIGGTKEHPNFWDKQFAVQEDNVSCEFNIPPCYTKELFVKAITNSLSHIETLFKKHELLISKKASNSFVKSELEHPMSWIFGCEPDFNAWTEEKNIKPFCKDTMLRTAGGHIHVGTKFHPVIMTKMLDLVLGVPASVMDKDILRKELYGKAGAFRPGKNYTGVEYRVLSNFWIFEPNLIEWVYNQVEKAITYLAIKGIPKTLSLVESNSPLIISAINKNNSHAAYMLRDNYPELVAFA